MTLKTTMSTTLIRVGELVASPWKNGGGVTREIAAHPQGAPLDTFVWRVSVADVAAAGPFSKFPGIDRTLVLLSGAGMLLDEHEAHGSENGLRTHTLTQPLDVARFAGEAAIDAQLVDGATRDFNLMLRRGAATGTLDVWRGDGRDMQRTLNGDVVLLYCAAGPVTLTLGDAASLHCATGDTLRIDAAAALPCVASAAGMPGAIALLAIEIRYA